jgi:hypothetical protein
MRIECARSLEVSADRRRIKSMTRHVSRLAAFCVMAAFTILPPISKAAGSFSTAVISTGTGNTQGTAATDSSGNSLVLWENGSGKISCANHPLAGPWSAPSLLSGTFPYFLQVKTTPAGSATAVWEDGSGTGIYVSDRSSKCTWGAPKLVVPGVYSVTAKIWFVMDSQGDQAILWTSGTTKNFPTVINAIRRAAGGSWGAQQVVSSNQWAGLDDAVLADNGDLVVAWHAFTLTCGKKFCTETNSMLHVARETSGGSSFQDSGSLGATAASGIKVAADATGQAAVVYQTTVSGTAGTYSIVEQGAGQAWSAPQLITTASALAIDLGTDSVGNLTVAFNIGSTVAVATGNTTSNRWSAVTTVSGSDYVYGTVYAFAESTSGAAVLSWTVAAPPNVQALEVRAISRANASGAWTAPQSISNGFLANGATIDGAAVNSNGNGVVVYDSVDASGTVRSIYASTF